MDSTLALLDAFPVTGPEALRKTRDFEAFSLTQPQVEIETQSVLHAGTYCRTIRIPAGVAITGALVKIETVLIVSGSMLMTAGDKCLELEGYSVIRCPSGRKQIMLARSDCFVTMIFATSAKTTAEAEDEFTDEAERLMTRRERVS